MNKRRKKTYEVYLLILEVIEKEQCPIEDAIGQLTKIYRITSVQSQLFRKWYLNDLSNFGIGDRNTAETTVFPDAALQNFRISTRGARFWATRDELLVLSAEIQAAIENPKLTRKIYESRFFSACSKLPEPIQAERPALSTTGQMVRA